MQLLSQLLKPHHYHSDTYNKKISFTVNNFREKSIAAITYDSRIPQKNAIFFALQGEHVDGHAYINQAIDNGAAVIVCARKAVAIPNSIPTIYCKQQRLFLSALAHAFYNAPSQKIYTVGVTGTDGKSTTAFFLYQLLRARGVKCGLISTVANDCGDGLTDNPLHQTTPEAPQLHAALARMVARNYTHAIIETSSHALSAKTSRVAHIYYRGAIITNITAEHIDFHKTRNRYRADKANILSMLKRTIKFQNGHNRTQAIFALSGAERKTTRYLQTVSPVPLISYSPLRNPCFTITIHTQTLEYARLTLIARTADAFETTITVPFFGTVNIDNLSAALLGVQQILNLSLAKIAPACAELRLPKGRMEQVQGAHTKNKTVIIDYAHTATAFKIMLPYFKERTRKRLIVLFGSAGERDTKKRFAMGAIAAQYADSIYLTDEDPRNEPSHTIIHDIKRGIGGSTGAKNRPQVYEIADRKQAIESAVSRLKEGDTLLLLGKGHENSILYATHAIPWDEHAVAQSALEKYR